MLTIALALALVPSPQTAAPASRPAESRPAGTALDALLAGVARVAAPGAPGCLTVFGPRAFVVVARTERNGETMPVIAAGEYGRGRVLAFGHGGYLGAESLDKGDTRAFWRNALAWLAHGKASPRVAFWNEAKLAPAMPSLGAQFQAGRDLAQTDVILVSFPAETSAADRDALAAFVERGGALVAASTGWGWQQQHPGSSLVADLDGNLLLRAMGLAFNDESVSGRGGILTTSPSPPREAHAGLAFEDLQHPSKAVKTGAVRRTLLAAMRVLPEDEPLLMRGLLAAVRERTAAIAGALPAEFGRDPLDALAVQRLHESWTKLPPEKVTAAPTAARFPGLVAKDASRAARTIQIEIAHEGWHALGLYAPPGERVRAVVAEGELPRGATIRVGCHTDELWHVAPWSRWPEISMRADLRDRDVTFASPHGGLLYLDGADAARGKKIVVRVEGAVESPRFVAGATPPDAFLAAAHAAAAPWGEIEGRHVTLTIPAAELAKVKDPGAVAYYWDRVWQAHVDLLGEPIHAGRGERIVADIQISAGYMHSGYPIMTHLDGAALAVDVAKLAREGSWGHFHELGHNCQRPEWTFSGTGEVTCNLFTLHAMETLAGVSPPKHPWFGDKFQEKIDAYLKKPDFEKWQNDPALALWTYVELQQAYGWPAFTKLFAHYRSEAGGAPPRTDADKRDQFCTRLSSIVGRNLAPFFDRWGIPLSAKARAAVAQLPAHDAPPPVR